MLLADLNPSFTCVCIQSVVGAFRANGCNPIFGMHMCMHGNLQYNCIICCCAYMYACKTIDIYMHIHGNNCSFYLQIGEEKNDSLFTSVPGSNS